MPTQSLYFANLKSAMSGAADLAQELRNDNYKVQGRAKDYWYDVGDYEYIEIDFVQGYNSKVERDNILAEMNEY